MTTMTGRGLGLQPQKQQKQLTIQPTKRRTQGFIGKSYTSSKIYKFEKLLRGKDNIVELEAFLSTAEEKLIRVKLEVLN